VQGEPTLAIANIDKLSKVDIVTQPPSPLSGLIGKMLGLIYAGKLSLKHSTLCPHVALSGFSSENQPDRSIEANHANSVSSTLAGQVSFFTESGDMMSSNLNGESLLQKKLSILQEISSTLALTENVSTIANLMIDLATAHTEADKGSIMLLNSSGELYIIACRGLDPELARTYRSTLDQGIVGKIANLKQPILVKDINTDERFKDNHRDRYRTRSFISCPIIIKDRLLGVININDRKDGQPFTEDDFTLVKILANQAAVAIRNGQLVTQLKAKGMELEDLNSKLINTDMAKSEFLIKISHELRSPLNSMKGALYCLKMANTLPPKDRNEFLDILNIETEKMVSIVEDQLDYLRLEGERILIKPSIIDLREIAGEVISSSILNDSLSRRKIRINVNIPENLCHVTGDKVLVNMMFIHLIEGVTYLLKRNASVDLTITEKDFVEVCLKVSQRFPETIASQLSNSRAFFQPDLTKDALKLILARKTAENHGWTMTTQNTTQGFEVRVMIPKETWRKMDVALTTAMDLYLDFISEMLNLGTCSIMLADEMTGDLTIRSAKGIEENVIQRTRIRVGERIAGWVAQEGKPLLIEDIEKDERFPQRVGNEFYNSKSLLSLPLKIDDRTIGVLNLNNKKSTSRFDKRDLTMISMVGERISHLVETLRHKDHRDEDYKQLATSLENLLNAGRIYQKKNPKLMDLVEKVSTHLGFDEALKNDAIYSSMVYDLGLMLASEGVLQSKRYLSSSEISTIKVHPHTTVDLLSKIEFSDRVKKAILHHHENWDGSGYPEGLKGNQIPVISRILAVADAYFSMIEARPYRPEQSPQEALKEIRRETGSKFDPAVIASFVACLGKGT
jgi:response regulator RpfG family c-di-GMP phosphodiesterase/signal transduction histidine kinase